MTTWIDRFTKMQPLDVLMTINEDVSTLIAFLNEVRDLRNPPGDERDMSAMQAARAVVDEAADEVLTLRAKLRNCEDQYKASANSRRLTNELRQNERIRELRAELESALDRNSALRDNEQILFRQLSDALTGGNASTWDEVLHAATVRAESTADLREAAGALDGFADRAVNPDAVPRLRELAQACRRAAPAAPEGETRCTVCAETALPCMGGHAGRALAPPPAPPAPALVDVFKQLAEAFWDMQLSPDCWCDTGDGNPHTPACLAAKAVTGDAQAAYNDLHDRPLSPLPSGPPAPVAESPMVNRYTCAHGVYFRMDCPDCEARRPNQPVEVEASTEEAKASATASAGRRDAMSPAMTPDTRPDVTALVNRLHGACSYRRAATMADIETTRPCCREFDDPDDWCLGCQAARRLTEQEAEIRADDARLRAAEARVWPDGLTYGCDAAEHLADEILTLRAEIARLREQNGVLASDRDSCMVDFGALSKQRDEWKYAATAAEQALTAARRERDV